MLTVYEFLFCSVRQYFVQWYWVVGSALNLFIIKGLLYFISVYAVYDILMKHVNRVFILVWYSHNVLQCLIVHKCYFSPTFVVLIQQRQFVYEHFCLYAIHPRIPSNLPDVKFICLSMITQLSDGVTISCITCHCTCISPAS